MAIVEEIISSAPLDRPERLVRRCEDGLFEQAPARFAPFLTIDAPPLAVYSFPIHYTDTAYGPPKGVFEGDSMRLEWQMINGRQPFYHRNTDVDEISFQISGERTLMTECGTVEMRSGQFALVPTGVAHDNFARSDVHLIFYIHGKTEPCIAPKLLGKRGPVPFPGWKNSRALEMVSSGMGALHSDVAFQMTDEATLLSAGDDFADSIELLEPNRADGRTEWIYKAAKVWIGHTRLERSTGRHYTRRLAAHEIQYQIEGARTLVTQRGVVELTAGDFVCIPLGCAFASVVPERSAHLSVLTLERVPAVREPARLADFSGAAFLAREQAANSSNLHSPMNDPLPSVG